MTDETKPPATLTQAQLEHYEREGYLVLRTEEHNLVDADALSRWSLEIQDLPLARGKWMPYYEVTSSGDRQLMRTENFADFHSGFSSLLCGPRMSALLAQLTGDDMRLFKDKINYKLPGGSGFGAHVDAPAYDHIPSQLNPGAPVAHTTANLAVDAATPANGCVEVVARSHRATIPLSQGGAIDAAWEQQQTWTPVPLRRGDALVFGSRLAHRSGPNTTDGSRASVYATYTRAADGESLREAYYADRREQFPPDHERVQGKDYAAGVARYAFAAPFTEIPAATATAV